MTVGRASDDGAVPHSFFAVDLESSSAGSGDDDDTSRQEIDGIVEAEFGRWKVKGKSVVGRTNDDNIELSERRITTTTVRRPRSSSTTVDDDGDNARQNNPRVSISDDWRWEDEDEDEDDDENDVDRIESITTTAANNKNIKKIKNKNKKRTTKTKIITGGEDRAWKIVSALMKGWCIIWVIFAISVVVFAVFSPDNTALTRNGVHGTKNIVTVEDEQTVLELSEAVITSCSYSNLDTEDGREGCRELCRNRMCCFVDEIEIENENDGKAWLLGLTTRSPRGSPYGCANDPEKMCAAFAGCQSLVVSEEDAIIRDADGVDVFAAAGVDSDVGDDDGGIHNDTTASDRRHQPQSAATRDQSSDGLSGAKFTLTSELRLVQQVINSVCSTDNLHTHRGILECASLCNPSICCFDRDEILSLNPKLDIILKMEGIDDTVLDPLEMGTCTHDGDGNNSTSARGHFCQAHVGCKNILVLGSPSAAHATQMFTNFGVHDEDGQTASSSSEASAQRRTLVAVLVLFGMIIGVTIYLLIYEREYAPLEATKMSSRYRAGCNNSDGSRSSLCREEEIVDFA